MQGKVLTGAVCALMLASSWVLAESRLTPSDKGQRIYQRNCLGCHGVALDGKGPQAGSLAVPPANFHSYLSRVKGDAELTRTIKEGRRYLGMHNWEDTLSDEDVRNLIAYIRSEAAQVSAKP